MSYAQPSPPITHTLLGTSASAIFWSSSAVRSRELAERRRSSVTASRRDSSAARPSSDKVSQPVHQRRRQLRRESIEQRGRTA